jgi:hypothetical protein
MKVLFISRLYHTHLALAAAAAFVHLFSQPLDAGVRGEFDFPREVAAVAVPGHVDSPSSQSQCYEVTIPISFRATKGHAADVLQLDIELTFDDDVVLVLDYQPQTTLAGDVVGEIEETMTTEDAKSFEAAVTASVPIPGLEAAQIGPSVNASDSGRTVRTQKLRRQPQLSAVVVSGSTARGRGVFFQLRPASDVTLEGAQHLTLRIAAPQSLRTLSLAVKCRAVANENWLLFERETRIASANGQISVALLPSDSQVATSHHHTERPCPWCDSTAARRTLSAAGDSRPRPPTKDHRQLTKDNGQLTTDN